RRDWTGWRRSRGSWRGGRTSNRSLLLPRLVARLGVGVHGIEAGKLRPTLDLADDKAFHTLVLGALLGDEGEEVLRDHHRAVVVADRNSKIDIWLMPQALS